MQSFNTRPVSAMNAFQKVAHWLGHKADGKDLNRAGAAVKTALSYVSAPTTVFAGSVFGHPVGASATALAFKIAGDAAAHGVDWLATKLNEKLNSPKALPVRPLTRREMALQSFA